MAVRKEKPLLEVKMPVSPVNRNPPSPVPSTSSTLSQMKSHRWSELVPESSALAFAAIWDTDEGIIAFSGAELLDLSHTSPSANDIKPGEDKENMVDSPLDIMPGSRSSYSQIFSTLDSCPPSTELLHLPLYDDASTLAYFRDTHQYLFKSAYPGDCEDQADDDDETCSATLRPRCSTGSNPKYDPGAITRTSSTMGGVDLYVRGSLSLQQVHQLSRLLGGSPSNRHYSCLEHLDDDFDFDPCCTFIKQYFGEAVDGGVSGSHNGGQAAKLHEGAEGVNQRVSDEGFFETETLRRAGGAAQRTRYSRSPVAADTDSESMEETSISRRLSDWSTMDVPDLPTLLTYSHKSGYGRQRRRLRKRRQPELEVVIPPTPPLSPSHSETDSAVSPTSIGGVSRNGTLTKFVKDLAVKTRKFGSPCASPKQPEAWVRIDVTQKITLRSTASEL